MSDLTHNVHAVLALLRDHPELLDDETNRDALRELGLVVRAALDDASSASLRTTLADLEEEFLSEA